MYNVFATLTVLLYEYSSQCGLSKHRWHNRTHAGLAWISACKLSQQNKRSMQEQRQGAVSEEPTGLSSKLDIIVQNSHGFKARLKSILGIKTVRA